MPEILGVPFETLFKTPPEKALSAWDERRRLLLPGAEARQGGAPDPRAAWTSTDVLHQAHSRAFYVARMTRADVLQDIRSAVDRAIREGIPFEKFRKELEPTLRAKGWWSGTAEDPEAKTEVRNPKTGQMELTRLGTPRRLRTIYATNMRVSYAAGNYQAMKATARLQPWWRYEARMDKDTRPSHARLHNIVRRHDDPIWSTLYPPNGWGCRCKVFAMSDRQVRARRDLDVQERSVLETKTVRVGDRDVEIQGIRTAHGTVYPDPQWAYNVGEYGHATETLAWDRIRGLPEGPRDRFLTAISSDKALATEERRGWESFVRGTLGTMQPEGRPASLAVGWLAPENHAALQGVLKTVSKAVATTEPAPFLAVTSNALIHAARTAKAARGAALPLAELLDLPAWIRAPYRVLVDREDGAVLLFAKPAKDDAGRLIARKAVFRPRKPGEPLEFVTSGREPVAAISRPDRTEVPWK